MSPNPAHPATLFTPLDGGKVRCTACARYCSLPPGSHGFCFVRKNEGGRLVLLTYGLASAVQVDPVEKKPLSHYRPGTRVLSIGTVGCNWRCLYCQNAEISQEREILGRSLPPAGAVARARKTGCAGITFTYNEPTIFAEYALDVIAEGHRAGLFANFVTNGYMTPEAVALLGPHLDAVSIDFKGSGEAGFLRRYVSAKGPEPILESAVGLRAGVRAVDVELVCSDTDEHRRRVEARSADIAGHVLPTWSQVVGRDYRPWDGDRLVIDTAQSSVEESVRAILAILRG